MSDPEKKEGEEMQSIRFTIPGPPFGKQRPKVSVRKFTDKDGKEKRLSKAYTPKETVSYENLVKVTYQDTAKGKRFGDDDMLDVRIIAYYEIPQSVSKKKRKLMLEHKIRPTKKPDFDNIAKVVCDSLNQIAFRDDRNIVDAQIRKFYSESPRVEVIIKKVG